jgi:hypothetical protein
MGTPHGLSQATPLEVVHAGGGAACSPPTVVDIQLMMDASGAVPPVP